MAAEAAVDFVTPPTDYAQLFERYFDYVQGLVIKLGIDPQSAEDVASEILIRFIDTDILEQFDEGTVIEHRGVRYSTRFKSFLSAKVEHYVRGKRDRQTTQLRREPLLCDQPVGEGGVWVEIFGGSCEPDLDEVEARDLQRRIREHLCLLTVRGKRDLVKLFDLIVAQLSAGKPKPDRQQLAKLFGVSDTAIGSMIIDLRHEVAEALLLDWPRPASA